MLVLTINFTTFITSKINTTFSPQTFFFNMAPAYIPDEIIRQCPNFAPSLWGDRFSSTIPISNQSIERYSCEVKVLKVEVRCMLTDQIIAVEEKLAFIDILQRLGISYHFDNEIEEELEKVFKYFSQTGTYEKQDLSTVSLYFRLLRQHGFRLSSQIFDDFRDENGFKENLGTNVKGLLNLYEAANTMIHGENILEEALAFASTHLELMIPNLTPSLAKQVSHTLEQPFYKGIPRVEARFFISVYEEEEGGEDSINDLVLRLAKLDYTLLQMLHRKELSEITGWWKELDLMSKLPYARDRVVECYFWSLGVYFEPQYSLARIMLTKTISMISIIDDTYDSYGTVEELKIFTQAVERWDISETDGLPEYMKALYKTLLHLYVSYEQELQKLGRSYAVSYAKERMKEIIQSYYIEAKWFIEGYTPSFEEYLKNGFITSTYFLLTTTSLLGIESATKDAFEWLKTNPKIMLANVTICRVVDDIATYEIEKKRGQITTGIDCYMKQYGVTKDEAMDECNKIVENAWKDMNEGCLRPRAASADIFMRILNFVRIIDAVYKHNEDGYTNPEKVLKPQIMAMLVDALDI